MTKRIIPYFNVYAADFKAFKDKISHEEWFQICDDLSDVCMFGEAKPKYENNYQLILYQKLHENLKKSLNNYNTSVENGRKGGRPANTQTKPMGSSQVNLDGTQGLTKEKKRKEDKRREESLKENKSKKNVFKKPTIEELSDYCHERSNYVNPERFIDHYTANGWKIGRNQTPMKDWKAAVRTWENNTTNERSTTDEKRADYRKEIMRAVTKSD